MRARRVRWYVCCEEDRPIVQYSVPGIYFWRPLVRKTVLKDGIWKDATEPAFPGYLFIGSPGGWRHIEESLPEVQLIRSGGKPHELDGREMMLARLFDGVHFNVLSAEVRSGDWVRVSDGRMTAFSGLEGRVVQRVPVVGGEQVCVEFSVGTLTVSECVPTDYLEAVR